MQLIYGKTDRRPFSTILYQYSDSNLKKLTRSTVPFLCYWKKYHTRLEKLSNMINIPLSKDIKFCFEFPVESYESNTPSFTDLMIISENYAIVIEGKWTESKYENVKEWLQKGNKSNRINVLKHWIRIIENYSSTELGIDDFQSFTYQLVHRVASACAQNRDNIFMVYQIFQNKETVYHGYFYELIEFSKLIKPNNRLIFATLNINIGLTDKYLEKSKFLESIDDSKKAHFIRKSILEDELFTFSGDNVSVVQCENTAV